MQLTSTTFVLLFLFFPGIVANLLAEVLKLRPRPGLPRLFLHSFVFAVGLYLTAYAIQWIGFFPLWLAACFAPPPEIGLVRPEFFLAGTLASETLQIPLWDVFWTSFLAVPVGFYVAKWSNNGTLHRYATRTGFSRKFGDLDVWAYLMNTPENRWVIVRDFWNDLAYRGWVEAFSDGHEDLEILLREVTVLRGSTGQKLYDADALYLAPGSQSITMELVPSEGDEEPGNDTEAGDDDGESKAPE